MQQAYYLQIVIKGKLGKKLSDRKFRELRIIVDKEDYENVLDLTLLGVEIAVGINKVYLGEGFLMDVVIQDGDIGKEIGSVT